MDIYEIFSIKSRQDFSFMTSIIMRRQEKQKLIIMIEELLRFKDIVFFNKFSIDELSLIYDSMLKGDTPTIVSEHINHRKKIKKAISLFLSNNL